MVWSESSGEEQTDADPVREQFRALTELGVIQEAFGILGTQLPSNLYYHTVAHTKDVLHETVLFAVLDQVEEREVELLAVAAAFHDTGFTQRQNENEPIGAGLARAAMQSSGRYSKFEIELVEMIILDTRLVCTPLGLRQHPSHDLSCYLLDGDLSNFGREDFFEKGELQRREIGQEQNAFLARTLELLESHAWLTPAARSLRQKKKEENLKALRAKLHEAQAQKTPELAFGINLERLEMVARLPLLLNSTLDNHSVIKMALEYLKQCVQAEASSVFLTGDSPKELVFWAMQGGEGERLEGVRMPAGKGIVGWVIERQHTVFVPDADKDERFFTQIDKESGFKTRDVICVPLVVRGKEVIGALQVLNKVSEGTFSSEDVWLVEQFAYHVALAVENSRLYQALVERNKKLEVLDRRKSEMISLIMHELKTPLNVIQTSADLIGSGLLQDNTSRQKMVQTLMNGIKRLNKLASQIKNVALVTEKGVKLDIEGVKVMDLLREVEANFSAAAKSRNLAFTVQAAGALPDVRVDRSLILIVLSNLISNAIRFTPDWGSVFVSAQWTAGFVEFEVRDTGIGIDETHLPLIFEKFYEVTNAMEHSSGEFEFRSAGLGLGLSTVHAILEAHGVGMQVDSIPGQGSTFHFRLPVAEE